jgi:hypothetical protein
VANRKRGSEVVSEPSVQKPKRKRAAKSPKSSAKPKSRRRKAEVLPNRVEPNPMYPTHPGMGCLESFVCGGCGAEGEAWIDRNLPHIAQCPKCGEDMVVDWSKRNITLTARVSGAHDGSIGQRKKKMMTDRSDKLAKSQWENVEPPVRAVEGITPRNPTRGGVLDPKGPFAKKQKSRKIFVPKGSRKA